MLRCTSAFCHCDLRKVGLIPKTSRALPPEPFTALSHASLRSYNLITIRLVRDYYLMYKKTTNIICNLYQKHRIIFFLIFLFIIQSINGCTYKYGKVDEYRQFPEYKGYLPVSEKKVRADWVIPVNKENYLWDYNLPQGANECEQLVKKNTETSELDPKYDSAVKIGAAVTLPLTIIPILSLLMVAEATGDVMEPDRCESAFCEYYGHLYPQLTERRKDHKDRQKNILKDMLGIRINIRVTDNNGRAIPEASLYEIVSPIEVPLYGISDVYRSFSSPSTFSSYTLKESSLNLIADHLPILYMSKVIFSDIFVGNENIFNFTSDENGKVEYTSMADIRYIRYSAKNGWYWARKPLPINVNLITWAPGFKSNVYSIRSAKPKDKYDITIQLEPLPDSINMQKVHSEFLKSLKMKIHSDILSSNVYCRINPSIESLKEITSTLGKWIEDKKAPRYIRWNAYVMLKSLTSEINTCKEKYDSRSGKGLFDDLPILSPEYTAKCQILEYETIKVEEEAKLLTPYLADSEYNPWQFKKEYENLINDVRENGINADIVSKTRKLLAKGESIFPEYPEFDSLRAIIALSESKREQALIYSRYLDHYEYFRLFYDLQLIDPYDKSSSFLRNVNTKEVNSAKSWLSEKW